MKKKIILSIFLAIFILALWKIQSVKTKEQSYYSGDAIYYQDKLIIASASTGKLDFFISQEDRVNRLFSLSLSANPKKEELFNDLRLEIESGQLKLYAIAGYSLYKYDISDLKTAKLDKKVKNNFWEWYQKIDKLGNNIVTLGNKSLSVWNSNLDIIDNHNINTDLPYSLGTNGNGQYIFSLNNERLEVYDSFSRLLIKEIPLNFLDYKKNGRKVFFDRITNQISVADDYYVKKFDLNANLIASFRHYGELSYDIESSYANPYLYFSDGRNVYQLNKADLSLVNELMTLNLDASQSWAMGLKLVNTNQGERLVVFNNSNILVLDANLNLIAKSGKINEDDARLYPLENLYLVLSNHQAIAGSTVPFSGGGFFPNEELRVSFSDFSFKAQADALGRFNANLFTPEKLMPGRYDIKVDGLISELSYSISLGIIWED